MKAAASAIFVLVNIVVSPALLIDLNVSCAQEIGEGGALFQERKLLREQRSTLSCRGESGAFLRGRRAQFPPTSHPAAQ
jgi:hypothetical protein